MEFEDSTFETASCMQVTQYIDVKIFLNEMYRVLKPGGSLIIAMSNILREDGLDPRSPGGTSYFTAMQMVDLTKKAGFLDPKVYAAFPLKIRSLPLFQKLYRKFYQASIVVIYMVPGGKWLKNILRDKFLQRISVHEISNKDIDQLSKKSQSVLLEQKHWGTGEYEIINIVVNKDIL